MKALKLLIVFILCILTVLVNSFNVYAEDETVYVESPWIYKIESNGKQESVKIVGYTGEEVDITVPWTLGDLEIKKIDGKAFGDKKIDLNIPANNISLENISNNTSIFTYELDKITHKSTDESTRKEDKVNENNVGEQNSTTKLDNSSSNIINDSNNFVDDNTETVFEEREDSPFEIEENDSQILTIESKDLKNKNNYIVVFAALACCACASTIVLLFFIKAKKSSIK